MKQAFFGSFLLFFLSTTSVLACYPDPKFQYDDIGSADLSIVVAEVAEVKVATRGQPCLFLRYVNAEYLYGNGSTEFSVTTCTGEIPQMDSLMQEVDGKTYLGFISYAEVLLGVVREGTNADTLRYAVPTCWGPLHYNLDILPEEERLGLIKSIKGWIDEKK